MTETTALPDGLDGELGRLNEDYAARPLAAVLDDVVAYNKQFIYHQHDSTHDLIALWCAHTHGLDKWDYSGRLYIRAPQPGVGKSEQAKVMQRLCPNDFRTVGVSAPGLFGAIDELGRPTFFIDEADGQFNYNGGKDRTDVTNVVNGGYEAESPKVVRRWGGATRMFETYCAMVIVGIDNATLPEATRTRCIPVNTVPKPAGLGMEKYRRRNHEEFQDEVRWQFSNAAMDWTIDGQPPFECRQGDLWEALWVVANAAGGDWPARCAKAAEDHQWHHDVPETKRFLRAVKDWFDAHPAQTKVQSSVLASHVSDYDDMPVMQGKGVTSRLRTYNVEPHKSSVTWWQREVLEPVFAMWL